jgi:DNA polymerase
MLHLITHRDFERWRTLARGLLAAGVAPDAVAWSDHEDDLLLLGLPGDVPAAVEPVSGISVSRAFVETAVKVACHRDPDRWNLLYRTLWRMTRGGERGLLDRYTDDDVARLGDMERAVRRDRHKMTAFVRFRSVGTDASGEERFVAWHRPDHFIVRLTAPFFRSRFATMRWTILTPDDSVSWEDGELRYGPGVAKDAAPDADDLESLWKTYYANIFNPARIKISAMKKELPVRHWPTLPETALIADLLADAPRRVQEMIRKARDNARSGGRRPASEDAKDPAPAKSDGRTPDGSGDAAAGLFGSGSAGEGTSPDMPPVRRSARGGVSAANFLPSTLELPVLRDASKRCEGCDLCRVGTQTVFGEGPADAICMFVGEQPGDHEDQQGRPFVGPAGQLLSSALQEVGIIRDECYVTNAVKHFKWEPRGNRRIHAKPSAREVSACRPWLEAEIAAIKPRMLVCLGSTAAQSLLGRDFRVTSQRGQPAESEWAPWTMATIHPSALLRIPDSELRATSHAQFLEDLRLVAAQLKRERKRA